MIHFKCSSLCHLYLFSFIKISCIFFFLQIEIKATCIRIGKICCIQFFHHLLTHRVFVLSLKQWLLYFVRKERTSKRWFILSGFLTVCLQEGNLILPKQIRKKKSDWLILYSFCTWRYLKDWKTFARNEIFRIISVYNVRLNNVCV